MARCTPVLAQTTAPSRHRLLRICEVFQIVGVSRSNIYDWVSAGTFPRSILISRGESVIDERELDAGLEERRRERDEWG